MKKFKEFIVEVSGRQTLLNMLAKANPNLKDDEELDELIGNAKTKDVKSAIDHLNKKHTIVQRDIDNARKILGER